jgi:hypothetical protein
MLKDSFSVSNGGRLSLDGIVLARAREAGAHFEDFYMTQFPIKN